MKINTKNLLLSFLSLCIVGLIACNNDEEIGKPKIAIPGVHELSVPVDTMTRWFNLIIPPNYDHTEPRPLLFFFHGGLGSMDVIFRNQEDLIQKCEEENWILVSPNGSNFNGNRGPSTWNAAHCCNPSLKHDVDDNGFIRKMIDFLSTELKIDENRIYATGHSNGGFLCHKLGAEMPDVFAAVAGSASTIGGQVDSLSPITTVQPIQPFPILIIHGMDDVNASYYGGGALVHDRIDISFRESVLFWANNNKCSISQADTTIINGLHGKVWIVDFNDCDDNTEVRSITIENQAHGWPSVISSGFDGTQAMIDFFKKYSK